MPTQLSVQTRLRAPSPCLPSNSLLIPNFYRLTEPQSKSTPNLLESSKMPRKGTLDILRTPQSQIQGNGYPAFRFSRTEDSSEDDIMSGYAKNQALGWYKEEEDPSSSKRAKDSLSRHGVAHHDWAYHRK